MASSLLRVKSFSAKRIISHVLQKSSAEVNVGSQHRNLMSISINTDTIPDVIQNHESYRRDDRPHQTNLQTLKEKEKGDWRFLTMEEKKQLYQLSFSQASEMAPTNEWKAILASTFTAMGLMTMGIYVWLSHLDVIEFKQPALIATTFPEDHEQMEEFFGMKAKDVSFDSQPRH